jgi:penicillin amidase
MLAVQKDVYSAYDLFLAREVTAAVSKKGSHDELIRGAISVLRKWDGQMDKDQACPMITELLSNTLRADLVRLILPPSSRSPQPPKLLPRPEVVETLLRNRPAGWVAKDDWDAWLLEKFSAALQDGRKRQGTPVTNWRWGRVLQWKLAHPLGKQLPFVDRFFDIGPVEMSGSGTTVKQTTTTLGPSERMVVDLGNLDNSIQNLVAGESGSVASPHYKDQWPAYYAAKSFPMEFDHVDAKEVLHVKPAR